MNPKNGETVNEQITGYFTGILTGEAYFKVVPDSLHPFLVYSGGVEVRVFGGKFNLKAYPEEFDIDVSLKEGKVKVALLSASRSEMVVLPLGH